MLILSDESLSRETDIAGHNPNDLTGLRIIIGRCSKRVSKPKYAAQWNRELKVYNDLLAASKDGSKSVNSLNGTQKIDQETFSKDGVTHSFR